MIKEGMIEGLKQSQKFFLKTINKLEESDSAFQPAPDAASIAYQVAHTAQAVEWFEAACFLGKGWDLNFEETHKTLLAKYTSLKDSVEYFNRVHDNFIKTLEGLGDMDLMVPLEPNPIMGEVPKITAISAILDHTAHHRGYIALTSRLAGKVPVMPYGE